MDRVKVCFVGRNEHESGPLSGYPSLCSVVVALIILTPFLWSDPFSRVVVTRRPQCSPAAPLGGMLLGVLLGTCSAHCFHWV